MLHPRSASEESCGALRSKRCVTCSCESKNVTLHVVNVLTSPYLDQTQRLTGTHEKYLLGMMEEAADDNSSFR